MLSYIHSFHAGNHADILKHLTLTLILESLCKKEKPFTVFDTHSGSGIYSLNDERLLKTGEAESGIKCLLSAVNDNESKFPFLLLYGKKYLEIVKKYYIEEKYPGSPLIENEFLREGDVQVLSELHPAVSAELESCFHKKGLKVHPQIHHRDGYEMLKALTPPKVKRGLCIIDPSFEDKADYEKCAQTVLSVHKKWSGGIIALWYPLLTRKTEELELMKDRIISAVPDDKVLDLTLQVKNAEDVEGLSSLYGSGMLIVNFPYELDVKMKLIIEELGNVLFHSTFID